MKLNKNICKNCITEWNDINKDNCSIGIENGEVIDQNGWTNVDENNWENGIVCCPYMIIDPENNKVNIKNANPKHCRYALEQILIGNNKNVKQGNM